MSIYDICGFKHVYDGNWGPNVGILLERSSWYKLQVGSSIGMVLKWHSTGTEPTYWTTPVLEWAWQGTPDHTGMVLHWYWNGLEMARQVLGMEWHSKSWIDLES